MKTEQATLVEELKELVGAEVVDATVISFVWDENDEPQVVEGDVKDRDAFPALKIRLKSGEEKTLLISRDPELNGPGWISVE